MAQHEDLQLLRALATTKQHDQLEHAADDHVHQRPEQTHLQGREDRRYSARHLEDTPNFPIEYVHRTGSQLGAASLTPEHRELVAEHHDLELLELLGPKAQRRELQSRASMT
jgi:hypothetical protein